MTKQQIKKLMLLSKSLMPWKLFTQKLLRVKRKAPVFRKTEKDLRGKSDSREEIFPAGKSKGSPSPV